MIPFLKCTIHNNYYFSVTFYILYIVKPLGVAMVKVRVSKVVFGRLFLDEWVENTTIDKIYGF